MKPNLFNLKIRDVLLGNGGRMSISEFRRQMGLRMHVKREEMPILLSQLRRTKGFKVSKRRIRAL
jgi:hypothetical protein